jgi:hypothetical protein
MPPSKQSPTSERARTAWRSAAHAAVSSLPLDALLVHARCRWQCPGHSRWPSVCLFRTFSCNLGVCLTELCATILRALVQLFPPPVLSVSASCVCVLRPLLSVSTAAQPPSSSSWSFWLRCLRALVFAACASGVRACVRACVRAVLSLCESCVACGLLRAFLLVFWSCVLLCVVVCCCVCCGGCVLCGVRVLCSAQVL